MFIERSPSVSVLFSFPDKLLCIQAHDFSMILLKSKGDDVMTSVSNLFFFILHYVLEIAYLSFEEILTIFGIN